MDMLVKLYEIDPCETLLRISGVEKKNNITIRRAMAYEKDIVVEFVRQHFTEKWAGWPSECDVAFSNRPLSCFIASCHAPRDKLRNKTSDRKVVGFACYDTTCRGFFGPSGVAKLFRRKGIGACLLLSALCAMRQEGYGYAIIGGSSNQEQWNFYSNTVGATIIDGSENSVYQDMLGKTNHSTIK